MKLDTIKDENNDEEIREVKVIDSFQRTGCMAAFESFQQFEQYADEIFDLIEDFASPAAVSAKDLNAMESGSESRGNSTSINVSLSVEGNRFVKNSQCNVFTTFCVFLLVAGRTWRIT